jgi:hypothetical protein
MKRAVTNYSLSDYCALLRKIPLLRWDRQRTSTERLNEKNDDDITTTSNKYHRMGQSAETLPANCQIGRLWLSSPSSHQLYKSPPHHQDAPHPIAQLGKTLKHILGEHEYDVRHYNSFYV